MNPNKETFAMDYITHQERELIKEKHLNHKKDKGTKFLLLMIFLPLFLWATAHAEPYQFIITYDAGDNVHISWICPNEKCGLENPIDAYYCELCGTECPTE